MIVDPSRLLAELGPACADAGIEPAAVVAWVVAAAAPPGTTPIAYLQPAARVEDGTVAVFRAVGAARAAAHEGAAHRLALFRELPGLPGASLGPMLRHELEHARRWERSGPAFYAADERLRAGVPAAAYALLPTEREANAAAAAYARRTLGEAALAELAAAPALATLLAAAAPADPVAETLELLGERVEIAPGRLPPPRRPGPLVEVVQVQSG